MLNCCVVLIISLVITKANRVQSYPNYWCYQDQEVTPLILASLTIRTHLSISCRIQASSSLLRRNLAPMGTRPAIRCEWVAATAGGPAVIATATPLGRRRSMVSAAKSSTLLVCNAGKNLQRCSHRWREMNHRRPCAISRMRPKIRPCSGLRDSAVHCLCRDQTRKPRSHFCRRGNGRHSPTKGSCVFLISPTELGMIDPCAIRSR